MHITLLLYGGDNNNILFYIGTRRRYRFDNCFMSDKFEMV